MNTLSAFPRIQDPDGHLVPDTGRYCTVCTFPLHPALVDPVHACCDTRGTR